MPPFFAISGYPWHWVERKWRWLATQGHTKLNSISMHWNIHKVTIFFLYTSHSMWKHTKWNVEEFFFFIKLNLGNLKNMWKRKFQTWNLLIGNQIMILNYLERSEFKYFKVFWNTAPRSQWYRCHSARIRLCILICISCKNSRLVCCRFS